MTRFEKFTSFVLTLVVLALMVVSVACGLMFASISNLRIYKVLNIVGVLWSIFGLLTLSYLIQTSTKFQASILKIASYLFGISMGLFPTGLLLGTVAALSIDYPSWMATMKLASLLTIPGGISMVFFRTMSTSRGENALPPKLQCEQLGGYFLLAGLVAQLAGAAFDLVDYNG